MANRTLPFVAAAISLAVSGAAFAQPADAPNTVDEIVIVAPPARAALPDPDVQVRTETVTWADLDLTSRFGARTLLTRIHTAVQDVCGPRARPIELAESADYRSCLRDTREQALIDVHEAILAGD